MSAPLTPSGAPKAKKAKTALLPFLRHLISLSGGILVGNGWATSQETAAIAGGIIALSSVIWGIWSKQHDQALIDENGH